LGSRSGSFESRLRSNLYGRPSASVPRRLKKENALGERPRHRGVAPEECHGYAETLVVVECASRTMVDDGGQHPALIQGASWH
jgi:hypothetical protein